MKRRAFIKNGSLATSGAIIAPSLFGSVDQDILDSESIKKVHLIFKTHLDIGFTDLAANVINTYMSEFIPAALSLSENLRSQRVEDRFVWTTGSWLIYQFLEKSNSAMRRRMEKAIEAGDMVWHGLPFTTHSEVADSSLFDLGIQLSAELDQRFGRKTIAAKMTDVPGHTMGIVPVLEKNGIEFLHIGVNPASTPPSVPPLSKWRTPEGSEVLLMYQKNYGDTMIIPGTQTAVSISFTGDNHGPQTPEQIANIYKNLRLQFPNAEVIASDLNAVARDVINIKNQLPVIEQELGDTWIHGIASDPLKIAQFREISRFRNNLLENKTINFGSRTDLSFGIPLLMVAEHTWGLDVKTWLKDWDLYNPTDFLAAKSQSKYSLMEKSWNEKREYIRDGISALPNDIAFSAQKNLESLIPKQPSKDGFVNVSENSQIIDTEFYELEIDEVTGAIIKLKDKSTNLDWATKDKPLCLFTYQTFSDKDYTRFLDQYLTQKTKWAFGDFGKIGLDKTNAISKTWYPLLQELSMKDDELGKHILIELAVLDEDQEPVGGCARNINVEIFFPFNKKEVQATLQWFNKPAYRLPEASWFSFVPPVANGNWMVDKMGLPVDIMNVVDNGNRKLHSTQKGAWYKSEEHKCQIESIDAPLVAVGERNLLNFDNKIPMADDGIHFCLHDNVWGTNFRMWFDDDMKYRFVFAG
ncbi:DUF5054 domain-containing protein [Sunxiuqinia sp. A32]|uniref:DUF5054 domain-containing protein n=1 Tax=Sunxiuqinia sp. A32 TaxID=3461496 RepID=UPI00404595A2